MFGPTRRQLFSTISAVRAQAKSYYEVLSITQNAEKKDIKAQFYKLSMECHPDRNAGDETAHARFLELNEAYSTLSDELKRRDYDRTLSNGTPVSPFRRTRTGPRTTMRRSDAKRPEDWVLHKPPDWMKSHSGPIFDYKAHHNGHYSSGTTQWERARAQRKAKYNYYNELYEAEKVQPRMMTYVGFSAFMVFFLFFSGMIPMIWMDDEECELTYSGLLEETELLLVVPTKQ